MASRTTSLVGVVLALAGLVVSALVVWAGLATAPAPTPEAGSGPAVTASVAPRPSPGATTGAEGPAAAEVPRRSASLDAPQRSSGQTPAPVEVVVGSISLEAEVRPVGVAADGQMELPANPAVLGWYRFGPAPAAGTGSVVLAGHLDSNRYGLGPLVGLRETVQGDRVTVRLSGGRRLVYAVSRIDRYDRQGLPADVFARTGPERLRLVTCGGEYDPDAGGYQQNLVVTARPVPAG